ncbi:hypothetical protein [Nocardia asteroides]|uniref:hypothetical protein n=1 Tax=Nocardia asteroides TaxID=1824 RepID=UPI001E411F55|nr:hypothetical protein [Nocardia asteroides]UGT53544.1 hypothetical protein LTT85_23015 [Nocardia asteroides]
MASLPARNFPDQDRYPLDYGTPDPYHRCGGACGRPGCRDVPQGYSHHTVPIRDEGYGQPVEHYEPVPEPTRGLSLPMPRVPRSRSLIAVVAILFVTGLAGLLGAKFGSDIDLFGAAETAVVQSF